MSKKSGPVEYIAAAVMLIACAGGTIYGLSPFGSAMFVALSGEFFIGFTAPVYLLCSFLFTFELWRLYTAGAVIFVTALRWFLGLKLPKANKPVVKAVMFLVATAAETSVACVFSPVADALISALAAVAFYYFAAIAAHVARCRFAFRLGVPENAAMVAVLFVFGLSCGRATVGLFIIGLAPAMLALMLLYTTGVKNALGGGIAVALGLGISSSLPLALAFTAAALCCCAFGSLPRIVCSLACIGVYAAAAVLFYTDPIAIGWNSLMLFCGAAVYVILPKRTVRGLRAYFDFDGSARLAVRHYINRSKADAGNRMLAVASVFDETARLMYVLNEPEPDHAAIGAALAENVCPYCDRQSVCDRAEAARAFTALSERAHKGKAILTDLPEFFTESCAKCPDIISAASAITDGARERDRERASEDKAKQIVAERLKAIKDVLEELGRSQAMPVGFDGVAEDRIAAELSNNGVECAQAFCTKTGVTAIVRTAAASREKIRKAVGACLKRRCEVVSLEKTQAAGWSVATLKKCPAYEAVYARAGLGKTGVSGDSYTFKRIGDRFLTALLDGMGSGSGASENSGAAVELIECFYRAGFDSDSVLTGVNRFLKLPMSENYSAADVVVCDLDTATADIIKIGSPPCYIKTQDTVLKIEGSSLPIGVLDEMRPFVASKRLYPGQMLILVTDGVSDCFNGDELPEFINGLSAFNPESAVTAIVDRALTLSGGVPRDDMTAIAFRLYEKKKK